MCAWQSISTMLGVCWRISASIAMSRALCSPQAYRRCIWAVRSRATCGASLIASATIAEGHRSRGGRCVPSFLASIASRHRRFFSEGIEGSNHGSPLDSARPSTVCRAASDAAISEGGGRQRMDTKYVLLEELLNNNYDLHIPVFQRPYEWKAEQVEVLLQDLQQNLDLGSEADVQSLVNSLEPYNLGTVILQKANDNPVDHVHYVVDGQQRLTTLILLFAVLHRMNRSLGIDANFIRAEIKLKKIPRGPRLTVWKKSTDTFKRILMSEESLEDIASSCGDDEVGRQMVANCVFMMEDLAEYANDENAICQWALYVLQKVELTASITSDKSLALSLFRAQTGRGMQLQPSDLLKAEICSAVSDNDERQKQIADWWGQMEADLGRDVLQKFLITVAAIELPTGPNGGDGYSVISKLIEHLRKKGSLAGFVESVLKPAIDAYSMLTGLCDVSDVVVCDTRSTPKSISATISSLSLNTGTTGKRFWLPIAMQMVTLHRQNPGKLDLMLKRLERFAAYLSVSTLLKPKAREERLRAALREVSEKGASATSDTLENIKLSHTERQDFISALEQAQFYKKKCCKMVLMRLDLALREDPYARFDDEDIEKVTVEHVLPQKPEARSQWLKDFSEQDRQELTGCLGNLVLLTGRRNAKAGRMDFNEKKQQYFFKDELPGGVISRFALTQKLQEEKGWTPSVVRQKNKLYVDRLKAAWDL